MGRNILDRDDRLTALRIRYEVHRIEVAPPWSALLLTQSFPVPPEYRATYRRVVDALLDILPEASHPYEAEAFIQMDRIDHRSESKLVRDFGRLLGDYGLGYFPDRPPPTTWTKEEFQALFPPAKLRPLFHDVMRVQSKRESIETMRGVFLGGGAFVQAFCAEKNMFYARATTQFKPLVTERKLRMFPYYAVQLTRFALETAVPETLDAWTCGAKIYLRESNEDNGLLVVRRGELLPAFRELIHARRVPDAEFLTSWTEEELPHG